MKKFSKLLLCIGLLFSSLSVFTSCSSSNTIVDNSSNLEKENLVCDTPIISTDTFTYGLKNDGTIVSTGDDIMDDIIDDNNDFIENIKLIDDVLVKVKKDGTISPVYNASINNIMLNIFSEVSEELSDESVWDDVVDLKYNMMNIVLLKKDGSVLVFGDNTVGQCDTSNWSNIDAIYLGNNYVMGLKDDGTLLAVGDNSSGQCNVVDWNDIVSVCVNRVDINTMYADEMVQDYVVGLKKDGTVVATGSNDFGQCNVSDWNDISQIFILENSTIGLKKDGTVVSTNEEQDFSNWTNISSILIDNDNMVGLTEDGHVMVENVAFSYGDIDQWENIKSVSIGSNYIIGLKNDGTVLFYDRKNEHEYDSISNWNDIVYICSNSDNVIGLKSDGSAVSIKNDVANSKWTDIKMPE